ncbi:hypothetical protein D3C76_1238710 [compost metagenome]
MLVVVADPRHHSGGLGRLAHLLGLFQGHRQGLFTIDRLARRQRRHGHGEVQVVGCGDGDQVDLRVVDQLLPITVGRLEPPAVGALPGTLGVGVGQGRQCQVQGEVEHRLGIVERQGMGTAHEAGANQTDAEITHEKEPFELLFSGGLFME